MKQFMIRASATILLIVASFLSLAWATYWLNDARCQAHVTDLKVYATYGLLSGCRVMAHDGRMIPLESVTFIVR